jgi:hypothetical protein
MGCIPTGLWNVYVKFIRCASSGIHRGMVTKSKGHLISVEYGVCKSKSAQNVSENIMGDSRDRTP